MEQTSLEDAAYVESDEPPEQIYEGAASIERLEEKTGVEIREQAYRALAEADRQAMRSRAYWFLRANWEFSYAYDSSSAESALLWASEALKPVLSRYFAERRSAIDQNDAVSTIDHVWFYDQYACAYAWENGDALL